MAVLGGGVGFLCARYRHTLSWYTPRATHTLLAQNARAVVWMVYTREFSDGVPLKTLRGGISNVNLQETLSSFDDKCPQNGSQNDPTAPKTTLECPHEGPSVVSRPGTPDIASGFVPGNGVSLPFWYQKMACRVQFVPQHGHYTPPLSLPPSLPLYNSLYVLTSLGSRAVSLPTLPHSPCGPGMTLAVTPLHTPQDLRD